MEGEKPQVPVGFLPVYAAGSLDFPVALRGAEGVFYIIGYGGASLIDVKTGQMTENRVQLRDGTIINFRVTSKSGSPAVEINIKKAPTIAVPAATKSISLKEINTYAKQNR